MQENAPPPSPALAHTLAEAPLPLRVRQILESLMDMLAQTLRPQLDLTVVELERVLFKRADTAGSSAFAGSGAGAGAAASRPFVIKE